jgi:hypothetical protein
MLNDYRDKYDKIAVISHQWILTYLISKKFDQNYYPTVLP